MINVTKTFLPPIEEYQLQVQRAWDNAWLTNRGELFDLSEAPFKETLITQGSAPTTAAARTKLQAVLDQHPASTGAKPDAARKTAKQQKRAARAK